MVSKESEQFLIQLRLYLITKGKNDLEINDITEELEVHLLEAEAAGKDVKHIIGESPKEYMRSIGESMKTDYRQMAALVPMVILLLAAYFSIGPAIEGIFALSTWIVWIAAIGGFLGLMIYGLLLFKVLPKFFHSKWGYILAIVVANLVTGLCVGVLLWYQKQGIEPTFIATPVQNNVIVGLCIVTFIASAIYTKTWFTILIPLFISIGPLANRFIPEDINQNPTYIFYTILVLLGITAVGIFIFIKKRKKK